MDLKLCVISSGTMIGMNDLLFDRTNVLSLKCLSYKGVVKCIGADDFLTKMKRDHNTWIHLNQYAIRKDVEFEEQIQKARHNITKYQIKGVSNF